MTFGKRFSIHLQPSAPSVPHCPICRGTGRVRAHGQSMVCKPCKGHGLAPTAVPVYREAS